MTKHLPDEGTGIGGAADAKAAPSGRLALPAKLNTAAATALRDAFAARGGQPLEVDAGAVTMLGGLCLQVLLAARQAWAGSGHALCLQPVSADAHAALDRFGVTIEMLQTTEGGE